MTRAVDLEKVPGHEGKVDKSYSAYHLQDIYIGQEICGQGQKVMA